jgi:hypothetical protein
MSNKYKLTTNKKEIFGVVLYQIEALVSFGSVVKGELGGYIEKENNLAQYGNAWVSGNARVYGNARVSGKLKINFNLCSRFNFEFESQIKLWQKLEKQFEKENAKILKKVAKK